MDLDPIQLFGGNAHDPASASLCGFTSKNEKKVTEYLDILEKYLKDHKVVELDEKGRKARESDDLKATKKAATAVETLI